MKVCCIIFAIVFGLITVEGQNYQQQDTNTYLNKNVDIKNFKNKPERRKRNRNQSFYKNHQDYLNAFQNIVVGNFLNDILVSVREIESHVKQGGINKYYPGYYDYRPSCSNKCEDTLKSLLSLYKELASQLKYSQPPPPQIIYVPYPVPATLNHPVDESPSDVTIKNTPKDTKPVWKDIPTKYDDDGSRTLSFKPKQPNIRLKIPPPPFDHGSKQAGTRNTSNIKPNFNSFIERFGYIKQAPQPFK